MSKQKISLEKDSKRFQLKIPPDSIFASLSDVSRAPGIRSCEQIEKLVNTRIREACLKKEFEQTVGRCIKGSGATAPVDLVVVIDTSGSMTDEAKDLSAKADAAIQAASKSCPSDLRVEWFGIEGTWENADPSTKFKQTYRNYLHGLGVPDSDFVGTQKDREDGAAAVIDLSYHFDWRSGASRAIFYLGDEALEGGDPQDADDVSAANSAISVAKSRGVTVFTYFGTAPASDSTTAAEYKRLADETNGQGFSEPVANVGGFQQVLEKIICASGGGSCQPIREPNVVPCLRMRWGDGPNDRIETHDTEILCITVCNPYSNVILKDFTLQLVVANPDGGPVATLPDGTPSVLIKPDFMISFGDIPTCDPAKPDRPSCISREVVLITSGAIEGKYPLFVVYCFEASFTKMGAAEAFELELVKS